MWELILKADFDFVFNKDADWLGLYKMSENKIVINLPVIITKIRDMVRDSENKPGFQFEGKVGTKEESVIDSRMERLIVNELIDTVEHETIHEATSDGVIDAIKEKSKVVRQELIEEVGEENAPPIENIEEVFKQIHYNLYQEYIVRMLQGNMDKDEIINVLARYVDNTRDKMKNRMSGMLFAGMISGNMDVQEIDAAMEAIQGHIKKLESVFITMIFEHQARLDANMLEALAVAVEGNIENVPNRELRGRMERAQEANERGGKID